MTPSRTGLPAAVLTTSALGLGGLGLSLLFAPSETAAAFGWGDAAVTPSLAASGFLALAILNWTGRGAVYGCIYGRPLILANLTFALTGGLTLFDAQLMAEASVLGWLPVALLALHGTGFLLVLRGRRDGGASPSGG